MHRNAIITLPGRPDAGAIPNSNRDPMLSTNRFHSSAASDKESAPMEATNKNLRSRDKLKSGRLLNI